MLRRFVHLMPMLAFLALILFGFNVGVTAAEKVGAICCIVDGNCDSKSNPLSPDKSAPCDCSTHLHTFVITTAIPFGWASLHSDAQPYTTLACAVPDGVVQDISQPPRIS